ncbi:MAG TPA: RNA-binding protein [Patescibacteria group bacterium]|nr:RNA-binding protein [Patescibacteria group bacterium]
MDKRLFVAGLPFSFNDQSLGDLFSQFGKVESSTVIIDRETGRSKGFGFVEMSTSDEAKTAIEKLNNSDVEGRKIVVNVARPREERPQGNFGSRGPRQFGNDRPRDGGFRGRSGGGQKGW